jgi:two-component system, NarL family, nitrate/nitrite response regulator NarL
MPLDLPSSRPSAAVAAAPVLAPIPVAVVARDPLVHAALRARLAATGEVWMVDDPGRASVLLWDPPALAPGEVPTLPAVAVEPGRDGLPPVVIALVDDSTDPMPLLAGGVRGLLRRNVDAERLRATIVAAELGLTVLDEDPADALVAAWSPIPERPPTSDFDRLTRREHEVLELLADGLSNRAIAECLGISAHTVKFHVDALLDKLSARSRTQVVVKAVRQGLLELV